MLARIRHAIPAPAHVPRREGILSTVTQHAPGTFCWPELGTPDPDGAKRFYTGLFGWTFADHDTGPGGAYTVLLLEGRDVAALRTLDAEARTAGAPAHWAPYVAVEDVDDVARKVGELGGRVVAGPLDVTDQGRMATVRDPLGASLCLWQARRHPGAAVLGEPGALGWTQLNATEPARAKRFYSGLFGWGFRDDPMPSSSAYTTWTLGERMVGGMMPLPASGPRSHWLVYFAAADVDESHARALRLGAQTLVAPSDIPGAGRFSVLADPQGAPFALVRFGPIDA